MCGKHCTDRAISPALPHSLEHRPPSTRPWYIPRPLGCTSGRAFSLRFKPQCWLLSMFLSWMHLHVSSLEVMWGSWWPGVICSLPPQFALLQECPPFKETHPLPYACYKYFSSFLIYIYSGVLISHIVEFSIFILCLTFNFNPRQLSLAILCKVSEV